MPCCTLHFKIRLQLNLLQNQDDSLATDHSEVINSSTNNAQCVLHHCYLWMGHISSQCNVFGNTLKPEHAVNTRNTTCILNECVQEFYIDLVCLFTSVVLFVF